MTRFVNLTSHAITAYGVEGDRYTIESSTHFPARVNLDYGERYNLCGLSVCDAYNPRLIRLPDPQVGTFYIVSTLTALYAPGRNDLLMPGPRKSNSSLPEFLVRPQF